MGSDLMSAIGFFLSNSWKFLTQITVPGTSVTFAALFVGLFLAVLGIRFFMMILNFPTDFIQSFNDSVHVRDFVHNGFSKQRSDGSWIPRNRFKNYRRRP